MTTTEKKQEQIKKALAAKKAKQEESTNPPAELDGMLPEESLLEHPDIGKEEMDIIKEDVATMLEEKMQEKVAKKKKAIEKTEEIPAMVQSRIITLPGGKCELRLITPRGYKVLCKGSQEKCKIYQSGL